MERDARGGLVLLVVGLLGVAAAVGYAVTVMTASTFLGAALGLGLALPLAVAGAARLRRGRLLTSPLSRRQEHLEAPRSWGRGLLRLVAFLVDGLTCALLGGLSYQLLRALPYDSDWRHMSALYDAAPGLPTLAQLAPVLTTHRAADEIGAGVGALVIGLYLFVPAAMAGATPGLALVGRVWTRSDGMRVGAVHGAVRALAGLVLSPLQTALALLGTLSGGRDRRGRVWAWGLGLIATGRRTLADVICRTEAVKRKRPDDGRG